jgi:PAS domain S-box-containing protein
MAVPHTTVETQLRLANTELNTRIAVLEQQLLEKEQAGQAFEDSAKRYRRLFETTGDGILMVDADTGRIIDINPFLLRLLRYSYDAVCGRYLWEIDTLNSIAASRPAFTTLQENEYFRHQDLPLVTGNGMTIIVDFVSTVYPVNHGKVMQCIIRDVTAHKQAEIECNRLMTAIEQSGEAIVITDARGDIEFVNSAFEWTTGYSREEAVGQNTRILKSGKQDDLFYHTLWETISSGRTWAGQIVNKRKDGTLYTEETTISPVCAPSGQIINYIAVKRDITELLRLEAQSQQHQIMEAVCSLAGGIAHDYNNMLSVIIGYAELGLEKTVPGQPLHANLEVILRAAKRSVAITRQLLVFARKQKTKLEILDLNRSVEGMLKILRQIAGDTIDLSWRPREEKSLVTMDSVQIGQILTNLCVNARGAISGVGKIIIETENVVVDETFCTPYGGGEAGDYVLLSVSDDGCGLEKEVLDQVFQPFFTSQKLGQITALGLSMVHGIVTQNNGFIDVYSEPGKGTIFKVYLPRHVDSGVGSRETRVMVPPLSRGETVLLVDDEPELLTLAQTMLEKLGYRVLAAVRPGEAIKLAREYPNEIQMLIVDIIMPEMNGRNLAERLLSLYPRMKILFMSGYTADMIVEQGVLDEDVNFIQKPFSMEELAVTVRDALREK